MAEAHCVMNVVRGLVKCEYLCWSVDEVAVGYSKDAFKFLSSDADLLNQSAEPDGINNDVVG